EADGTGRWRRRSRTSGERGWARLVRRGRSVRAHARVAGPRWPGLRALTGISPVKARTTTTEPARGRGRQTADGGAAPGAGPSASPPRPLRPRRVRRAHPRQQPLDRAGEQADGVQALAAAVVLAEVQQQVPAAQARMP